MPIQLGPEGEDAFEAITSELVRGYEGAAQSSPRRRSHTMAPQPQKGGR